jgi:hypothetical protein
VERQPLRFCFYLICLVILQAIKFAASLMSYLLFLLFLLFHSWTMRRPGFEPGLPDWQSDVLDQTGRPSRPFQSLLIGY